MTRTHFFLADTGVLFHRKLLERTHPKQMHLCKMMSLSVVNIPLHSIFSYNFVLFSHVQFLQFRFLFSDLILRDSQGFWRAVSLLVLSRYPFKALWGADWWLLCRVCDMHSLTQASFQLPQLAPPRKRKLAPLLTNLPTSHYVHVYHLLPSTTRL